jgi:hypothetical protein
MKRTKIQKVRIEPEKLAYKYFLMGLNSHEIGLLIDKSYRTVQGYAMTGKWNLADQNNQLKEKAAELHNRGQNLNEIALSLGVGRSTVHLWIKQAKKRFKHCTCTPDESTGWITVKHCNLCGKPLKGEI